MVRINPLLKSTRAIKSMNYVCSLTLQEVIEKLYPYKTFDDRWGQAGAILKHGHYITLNGRVATVIYGYADFTDKKKVPLSQQNRNDLIKLGLLRGA